MQSFKEIRNAYPDEWLILGNPVMSEDEQHILAADLLYHSPDKHELAQRDKPLMKNYRQHAFYYNCVTPRSNAIRANLRTVGRMAAHPDAQPVKSIYDK